MVAQGMYKIIMFPEKDDENNIIFGIYKIKHFSKCWESFQIFHILATIIVSTKNSVKNF